MNMRTICSYNLFLTLWAICFEPHSLIIYLTGDTPMDHLTGDTRMKYLTGRVDIITLTLTLTLTLISRVDIITQTFAVH